MANYLAERGEDFDLLYFTGNNDGNLLLDANDYI